RSTLVNHLRHAEPWAKSRCQVGANRMVRHAAQAEALSNGGKHQNGLHCGEAVANTLPWAATEREVGKAWQTARQAILPALRTELLWLIKKAAVPMRHPLADEQRRAALDAVGANLAVHD